MQYLMTGLNSLRSRKHGTATVNVLSLLIIGEVVS